MRRLLVVVALIAACDRGAGPAAKPAAKPHRSYDIVPTAKVLDVSERGNLLNIAYGASVVSRTAEITLDQSALRAIDGDPSTTWASPPSDGPNQTIVFALAGPAHAQQVGIQTPSNAMFHIDSAQLDSSLDGVNFTPLVTMTTKKDVDDPQLVPVDRDILYLRLTTLKAPGKFAQLNSVQVHGRFTGPVKQQPLAGCWTINDLAAQFHDDRGRITGTIGGDHPISFEGGSDGLVYRFVWVSGASRGFGAIGTAPDGKHLSGLRWYEEPMNYSASESWFGQRSPCGALPAHQDAAAEFLRLKHRLPLYSLQFDPSGTLVEKASAAGLDLIANLARQPSSQRPRLVSREYRLAGAEDNKRAAQARLGSLRSALQKRGIDASAFEWIVLGSEKPPSRIETEIQRNLYSAIELQTQ